MTGGCGTDGDIEDSDRHVLTLYGFGFVFSKFLCFFKHCDIVLSECKPANLVFVHASLLPNLVVCCCFFYSFVNIYYYFYLFTENCII